jgi:hypothetical protein
MTGGSGLGSGSRSQSYYHLSSTTRLVAARHVSRLNAVHFRCGDSGEFSGLFTATLNSYVVIRMNVNPLRGKERAHATPWLAQVIWDNLELGCHYLHRSILILTQPRIFGTVGFV